jgi:hypothetical protein
MASLVKAEATYELPPPVVDDMAEEAVEEKVDDNSNKTDEDKDVKDGKDKKKDKVCALMFEYV